MRYNGKISLIQKKYNNCIKIFGLTSTKVWTKFIINQTKNK